MYLLLTINISFSPGNNDINRTRASLLKMFDDSFSKETSSLRNKTEASIREMKTMLLDLHKELKRNITSYWMNQVNSG